MENERTDARRERLHQRVVELLPWYVNGTLAEGERALVEEHLAGCGRCRAELPVERELARAVNGSGAVAPSPHPVQLARLMARIDAEERHRRPGRRLAVLGDLARATPRPIRWLVAAQLAAVLLLATLAWPGSSGSPGSLEAPARFHTLSDPAAEAPAAARLSVVFAPGASERQMRDVLASVRGQIVGGPSPLGVYTVAVPSAGETGEPLAVVLGHLRSRPEVAFAEPVAGSGGD